MEAGGSFDISQNWGLYLPFSPPYSHPLSLVLNIYILCKHHVSKYLYIVRHCVCIQSEENCNRNLPDFLQIFFKNLWLILLLKP